MRICSARSVFCISCKLEPREQIVHADLLTASLLHDLEVLEDALRGELDSLATLADSGEILILLVLISLLCLLRLRRSSDLRNEGRLEVTLEGFGILHNTLVVVAAN